MRIQGYHREGRRGRNLVLWMLVVWGITSMGALAYQQLVHAGRVEKVGACTACLRTSVSGAHDVPSERLSELSVASAAVAAGAGRVGCAKVRPRARARAESSTIRPS